MVLKAIMNTGWSRMPDWEQILIFREWRRLTWNMWSINLKWNLIMQRQVFQQPGIIWWRIWRKVLLLLRRWDIRLSWSRIMASVRQRLINWRVRMSCGHSMKKIFMVCNLLWKSLCPERFTLMMRSWTVRENRYLRQAIIPQFLSCIVSIITMTVCSILKNILRMMFAQQAEQLWNHLA